jgi:hypothetical protein
MRRGRWTAIAAALAIAATTVATAGCGGGTSDALSFDPVAAAATKTQQAGAAHVRFALSFSSSQLPGGKTVHVRGAGAVDGTSSELTFTVGPQAIKEISLEQGGDYVAYLQLAALSAHLPGNKPWIEVDLSKLGKSAGFDLGTLLSGSQLQPGDLLAMLKASGAKISNLGPATVDGAATTHYRVTIDVAKALESKGLANPMLGAMVAQMPTIPADVWIGKDGLVHRIEVSAGQGQSNAPVQLDMTLDISDYGADVTIAAPPSSDVFDATQLAQQGIAGGTVH